MRNEKKSEFCLKLVKNIFLQYFKTIFSEDQFRLWEDTSTTYDVTELLRIVVDSCEGGKQSLDLVNNFISCTNQWYKPFSAKQ